MGEDPQAARTAARAAYTVADYLEGPYLSLCRNKNKDKTVRDKEVWIKKYLVPAFGRQLMKDVTRSDIYAFRKHFEGKAEVTWNRCFRVLRHAFQEARAEEIFPKDKVNPCIGVDQFQEAPRQNYLLPDTLMKVIAHLDRHAAVVWKRSRERFFTSQLIKTLIYTGCRKGEIMP